MASNCVFAFMFCFKTSQIIKRRVLGFKVVGDSNFRAKIDGFGEVDSENFGCLWRFSEREALLAARSYCESRVAVISANRNELDLQIAEFQTGVDVLNGVLADNG